MEPRLVEHPPFTVVGLHARTTNAAETNMSTAHIPALWGAYVAGGGAAQVPQSRVGAPTFAVYTGYEGDHGGAYDVVVGAEVTAPAEPPRGWRAVHVPGGRFLVFTGRGAMPDTVFRTWAAVWEYFEGRTDVRRAYTADFEVHDPTQPDVVAIWVAVGHPGAP